MKKLSVGIIGLGAIGSRLVEIISKDFSKDLRIDFLCDLKKERVEEIRRRYAPRARGASWPLLVQKSDLIIEAASQKIVLPIVEKSLRANKQVLVLSVGGLIVSDGLSRLVEKTKGKLWIPSGALAGVDGLLAARQGEIREVTLTTRKPLRGLEGAPYLKEKKIELSAIKEPTLIFEGNALEAIQAFPQNVNVAATLSLAGIGPKKTKVRVFTSPTYQLNQHEVEIEGSFGKIRTEMRNLPSRMNPKTSELAILSAVATIRKILSHIHIGT